MKNRGNNETHEFRCKNCLKIIANELMGDDQKGMTARNHGGCDPRYGSFGKGLNKLKVCYLQRTKNSHLKIYYSKMECISERGPTLGT